MKLLATSALALCLMVLIGCAEGTTTSPETSSAIADATNKVEANISGMDCTGCSGAVVAAVEGIEGVTAAQADVKTGAVQVALTEDVDVEAAKAQIEKVLAELQDGKYTVNTIAVSTAATEDDHGHEHAEGDDHDHAHADGDKKCCGKCKGEKKEGECCGKCKEEKKDATEATEEPQADAASEGTVVFTVAGLNDAETSEKITKAVTAVEGVEGVSVCLKSGKCTVVAADGKKICSTSVTKAIEATGHAVQKSCGTACEKEGHDSKKQSEDDTLPQADAAGEGTVFTVTGMTCGSCSDKLTKAVSAVEGVESVTVCHKSGKCAVVAKDGAYVCPVKVTKTIEATGFKVAQQ